VVRLELDDEYDLGQEFFRWEVAVAVAGAILGINPFDQPDVEASKIATRKLTADYERPTLCRRDRSSPGGRLRCSRRDAPPRSGVGRPGAIPRRAPHRLTDATIALLAYIEMNEANDRVLQTIRIGVRDARRVATCVQFGPRFLHSTGQAYKGGPNTGVPADHAMMPPTAGAGTRYVRRGQGGPGWRRFGPGGQQRRALRGAHLGSDVAGGLATLHRALTAALKDQSRRPTTVDGGSR
jgi:transaldolase/glucose-6-phosphate isomerase